MILWAGPGALLPDTGKNAPLPGSEERSQRARHPGPVFHNLRVREPDHLVAEQPELHIHPALQMALGDLFIEAVTDGDRPPQQFLIETHSEHLLLRLLRRLRENNDNEARGPLGLYPEDLAIYFVEGGAEGMQIRLLSVDEGGRFNWPKGFFDEREREFFGDPGSISDEDLGKILGS